MKAEDRLLSWDTSLSFNVKVGSEGWELHISSMLFRFLNQIFKGLVWFKAGFVCFFGWVFMIEIGLVGSKFGLIIFGLVGLVQCVIDQQRVEKQNNLLM